ncbi:hypothetical protein CYMTET_21806 [Cymbomonas tetramitiformis]|uniref:O-GlcNAc transferase C-terminal domain-containing protein n=1 Tax=Cymbomonas tetramitiformis TaxID=36881 RepID=A0AAE0G2N1_9CHLO|nr:hypothetical protein CYMTET_21806 [Cymbomonas tetramitiformis]
MTLRKKASSLKPQDLGLAKNLANAQAKHKKYADASSTFSRVLELDGTDPTAISKRAFCRQQICEWSEWDLDLLRARDAVLLQLRQGSVPSMTPFDTLSLPLSSRLLMAVARMNAKKDAAEEGEPMQPRSPSRKLGCVIESKKNKGCRLRIGYVSSDFREHPTGFIMHHLLQAHSREAVEVYVYSINPNNGSPMRDKIEQAAEHFIDINPMTPKQAAERIRADGIDVLINLNGYTLTARNGIFAHQAAPIQVLYMGYAATMGSKFIQYVISDRASVPPEFAGLNDEKAAHLPNSYLPAVHHLTHPNDSAAAIMTRAPPLRSKYNLPEDGFIYCSFNTVYKNDPVTFTTWMQILSRVPGSVLWMQTSSEDTSANLAAQLAEAGVNPSRLVLLGWLDENEHLSAKSLCQLFLDTPNYNAHVTGTDALYAGIPVLSLPVEKMGSRVGASLLHAVGGGLPEQLLRTSYRAYEDRAVAIASEAPDKLKEVLRTVPESPLMALDNYVHHLESAFHLMWELHAAGMPPQPLQVFA